MDRLSSILSLDCDSGPYCFIFIAAIVIVGLYLYDTLSNSACRSFTFGNQITVYGYEEHNGPACWPQMYPAAAGCNQSPINLKARCAVLLPSETVCPLVFSSEYQIPPQEMKIYNSGHNVVIYAKWCGCKTPMLSGGPLSDDYNFHNIRLRWGPNDSEGSEHMVDSTRYAMEMQVSFVKPSPQSSDVLQAAKSGNLLILSYFFMVTPKDNPFMEPIVTSLQYIKHPSCSVCIEPIILSLLLPDFSRDYFTYLGSLTFPPCTEGVLWIIKPEPLMISAKQLRKFRKLKGCSRLITNNTRPVQTVNNRDIYYYD